MNRSPQDVFSDHLAALATRDVGAIVKDYAEDAIVLTQQGALEGRTGVEQFYKQAFDILPDADFQVKRTVFGPAALLVSWTASASAGHVDNGIDTLTFSDGRISLHASTFTITPRSS